MHRIDRRHALILGAGAILSAATPAARAAAGAYPSKPIKFILPFTAGGGTDESSRALADELEKVLKVPVVSENRPGASGAIAVHAVTSMPADGYTVLIATNSLVAVNPVAVKNLTYDPFKDLTPVHGITVSPPIVSAPLNSRYGSVKDALLESKAGGQPLKIGNYSAGYELLAAWIGHLEGVPVIHVPYKGPSNMLVDLVGGQLDLAISDPASAQELIKTGRIKGMASGADQRDPTMPEVPTMKELGYPEFESYVWASTFVKAGTPPAVLATLADAIGQANRSPAMEARRKGRPGHALNLALDEMGKFQRQEYERFRKVAKVTNYQPN
ncbi:MAG: tripartite tricarboxylate transporter substrate binding protein [Burkholderiaceae bacterium]